MFRITYLLLLLSITSYFEILYGQNSSNPFITVWKTDNPGKSNNNQISFLANGTDFLVEWESVDDASINGSATFSGDVELTFPSPGTYRVKIGQGLTGFSTTRSININSDESDAKKVIRLEQWGDIAWQNLTYGFNFATNLEVTATDAPNLSNVTSLYALFYYAEKMNADVSAWNIAKIENLTNFADQSAMSTANIDKMLRAWAELDVQENVTLGLGQKKYRFAKAAVQKLQSEKGWNITAQECTICAYTILRGKEGWRMISVPFPDVTVAQLLEPFWTQGVEGADVTSGSSNVLVYNVENEAFEAISTLNQTFPAGTGLLVWVYTDDDATTPGSQGGFPKILERSDAEHNDDVTPTLNSAPGESETVGWTLLGNPFNASVQWNKLARGTGIVNSVYVWSARDSSYVSFNGAVGGLSRGVLAPFQGFWIQNKRNGARDFKFKKSAKEDDFMPFYSKEMETQFIKLEIHQNGHKNSTWIMFDERASLDEDDWDALKLTPLSSSYIQLATKDREGVALDIQAVPVISSALHLPLIATSTTLGAGSIAMSESTIPENWNVYLKDLRTETLVPITNEAIPMEISTVKAKQNPSLKPESLFAQESPNYEIVISPHILTTSEPEILPTQLALLPSYPNPFNPTTTLRFSLPETGFVQLSIFDISGRKVTDLVSGIQSAGEHSVVWDASQQSSGTYLLRLTANGATMNQKLTLLK